MKISFVDQQHEITEEWSFKPEIFCPKCGHNTVWINQIGNNYEDNAGYYYLCTDCKHDWHMYGLDGYYGVERTDIRVKELLNERANHHRLSDV